MENKHIPNLNDTREEEMFLSDVKLLLSLRHFVTWNGFVEKVATKTFKVEDIGPDRYIRKLL
jgi:hypothetical protein